MRKLVLLGVLSLAVVAEAYACSCAPVDLERDLPTADGAIIGTVLERTVAGETATYRFRVEQIYKGDIDSRADVVTPASGAACGLEAKVGDRLGLLLDPRRATSGRPGSARRSTRPTCWR